MMNMDKIIISTIPVLFLLHLYACQDTTTTVAPTTIISVNVSQNVSVNPNQVLNIRLGGARGKFLDLFKWIKMLAHKDDSFFGRCLGAARKLKFIMPFLLFKLGVITTTLGFLTLFSLKGLAIGILLLLLNTGGIIGKLAYLKGHSGHEHEHEPPKEIYIPRPQPSPAVHLHVHKDHDGNYNLGHHPPPHYEVGPTAWSDRITKGFNVRSVLNMDSHSAGVGPTGSPYIYPGAQERASNTS